VTLSQGQGGEPETKPTEAWPNPSFLRPCPNLPTHRPPKTLFAGRDRGSAVQHRRGDDYIGSVRWRQNQDQVQSGDRSRSPSDKVQGRHKPIDYCGSRTTGGCPVR